MARRLAAVGVRFLPVLVSAALMAGCGGDATTSASIGTTPPPGPVVAGTVFMPNGTLARLQPSLLERFAALSGDAAFALTGNVSHVGANIEVDLRQQLSQTELGPVIRQTFTDYNGQYALSLDSGVTEGACPRLIVSVGNASTLTRAFVYSTTESIDIDAFSEAAVRIILAQGDPCALLPSQIRDIVHSVSLLPGSVSGGSTAELNQFAVETATAAPAVQATVAAAFGTAVSTPTPPATSTPPATQTPSIPSTPPSTSTPTLTFTLHPTNTFSPTRTPTTPASTPTPTRTAVNTNTATVVSTNTPTQTPGNTSTATNTPVNTATSTAPSTATNTAVNTLTNTPGPTSTATVPPTDTATAPATNTPTITPVSTATITPAETPTSTLSPTIANTPTITNSPVPGVTNTNTPTNTAVSTASGTPTNTVPATATNTAVGTATNTASPAATSTATRTVTNTSPPATLTPTPTSTGSAVEFPAILAPGGGSSGNCRGKCLGGSKAGAVCGTSTDCAGPTPGNCATTACVGGANDGQPCLTGTDCPAPGMCNATIGVCLGGPFNGNACKKVADCNGCVKNPPVGSCAIVQSGSFAIQVPINGVCAPRSFPPGDFDCVTDAECHTCVGGSNGQICRQDSDCAGGTCSGAGTCQLAGLKFELSAPDANGVSNITIPKSSLILNPTSLTQLGQTVCIVAGGDGIGKIDCKGGSSNLSSTVVRDHNTTAQICLSGTKKGMACKANGDCPNFTSGQGCNLGNSANNPTPGPNNLPNDPTCTNKLLQPDGSYSFACLEGTKQCAGGMNPGALCTSDADCSPGVACIFCNIGAAGGANPGVCNSPQSVTFTSAKYQAGDADVTLPLAISLLPLGAPTPPIEFGPDHLPCTDDDNFRPPGTPTPAPLPAVSVFLSTGTNGVVIDDVNSTNGKTIQPGGACGFSPCVAQIVGQHTTCDAVTAGNVNGVIMGGGFPALEAPKVLDITTVFQFVFATPGPTPTP